MSSVLLIDNYDSFTFNLQHLLAAELGELPVVCRNDEIPFEELRRGAFRALVISPGPGRPEEVRDFGGCGRAIRELDLPILGVCLGHQGIATAFGGAIEPAPRPVHGEATEIRHDGAPMFADVPERFEAVRYHSWAVAEPLPACLEVTARAADGAVMALVHRTRPIWGVQFHPESIGTEVGAAIVHNFVIAAGGRAEAGRSAPPPGIAVGDSGWGVLVEELGTFPDPGSAFEAAFGEEENAFWLDDGTGAGRSFIGASVGPGAEVLTEESGQEAPTEGPGETIFDLLRRRSRERRVESELPFDLVGGYVGYLGYGLKSRLGSPNRLEATTPDACFMAATEVVAFDHRAERAYAVGLVAPGASRREVGVRLAALRARLEGLPRSAEPGAVAVPPHDPSRLRLALDRPAYLDAVATAQRELHAGESYELCLTNRLSLEVGEVDPLAVFRRQRSLNPAPYGAFLRFGDLTVLSSSPERFLRIARDGAVETRPVKGTRPRGAAGEEDRRLREELRASVKDRAENLMIVDLLRNDLSRVCEVGSVEVEELFGLETHPHVHQLVSTIRGRLRDPGDPLACVETCFPGGSMTGAPKLRSMEILDRLEPEPRGIYSGALGYVGAGGGVDLSIVIRTAVLRDGTATVGSGGAITVRSDPEDEWEEMLLKARPTLDVLGAMAEPG